jgi:hypothetical protein
VPIAYGSHERILDLSFYASPRFLVPAKSYVDSRTCPRRIEGSAQKLRLEEPRDRVADIARNERIEAVPDSPLIVTDRSMRSNVTPPVAAFARHSRDRADNTELGWAVRGLGRFVATPTGRVRAPKTRRGRRRSTSGAGSSRLGASVRSRHSPTQRDSRWTTRAAGTARDGQAHRRGCPAPNDRVTSRNGTFCTLSYSYSAAPRTLRRPEVSAARRPKQSP